MKKNKSMRLASYLLILTLITTSVIGGAFAKYITSDSAHDIARVAKFGVVATVSGDLFAPSYTKGTDATANGVAQKWAVNAESVAVNSTDGATVLLVAPGTHSKDGLTFTVKGTPEVSTQVTFGRAMTDTGIDANYYPATVELKSDTYGYGVMVPYTGTITDDTVNNYFTKTGDNFTKVSSGSYESSATYYEYHDGTGAVAANYYPIVWKYSATNTLNSGKSVTEATDRDLKTVFTAIQGAFNGETRMPNQDNGITATINWYWNFEDDDYSTTASDGTRTPTDSVYSAVDRMDTALGDMIALGGTNTTGVLNTDQYVVKMTSATAATVVKTATVNVLKTDDVTSANSVTVAYTGTTAPTSAYTGSLLEDGTASSNICAVLGVAFDAAITVAQVD